MKNICGFLLKNDEAKQMLQRREHSKTRNSCSLALQCAIHIICNHARPHYAVCWARMQPYCLGSRTRATEIRVWPHTVFPGPTSINPDDINSYRRTDKPGPSVTSLLADLVLPTSDTAHREHVCLSSGHWPIKHKIRLSVHFIYQLAQRARSSL